MIKLKVHVPWPEGLHLRPAAQVVRVARRFRARILVRAGARVADAGSTLSLLVLCATLNSPLEIEAAGDDEQDAVRAIACCFDPHRETHSAPASSAHRAGPLPSDTIENSG